MSDEFVDYVIELLGPFGTVRTRRMFGGYGVYLDGLMFAIVAQDTLYLKADEMNRVEFEQAGCEIFGYTRKGKRATLNFFRAPDDAMETPQRMLPWARTAYAAALRTNAKKQAAGQAKAARNVAPQQRKAAARVPTLAKNGPTNRPRKKAAKKKTAGPAKARARDKRS